MAEVGMTLKERMALLSSKTNNNGVPLAVKPVKPPLNSKPAVPANKPAISTKPSVSPNKPTGIGSKSAASGTDGTQTPIDIVLIEKRKNSLRAVDSERKLLSPAANKENSPDLPIVTDNAGKKFKKLTFVKKINKPTKCKSLLGITLPVVKLVNSETGVELRVCGGRKDETCNSNSLIKSMTEEDEELEAAVVSPPLPKPHLPKLPPPSPSAPALPNRREKPLPVPAADPGEELYDDGDAGGAAPTVEEDLQEVYEEFDDGTPITASVSPPSETPSSTLSSDKKLTKEEKEKKKKEKKEQERLQKIRMNEIKEQEALIKKLKISEDELVSSHYVQAKSACSGSGKNMLAMQAKETVALIRKDNCPAGKWIVKNVKTQIVGLVDASNMIDLEEESIGNGSATVAVEDSEEQIYEELDL